MRLPVLFLYVTGAVPPPSASAAFSTAYPASAMRNIERSFSPSPKHTSRSQPHSAISRFAASALLAAFGMISK